MLKIAAERDRALGCAVRHDRQQQRIAEGVMPDLGGIDPVPVRPLARLQQIENVSRALAAAGAETIEVDVDGKRWTLPLSGIRKAHLAPQA